MKKMLIVTVLLICGTLLAEVAMPPAPVSHVPGQTKKQRNRKRLTPEQQMEKFGGFVQKDYVGYHCYFLDAQSRGTAASFDWVLQQIRQVLSLPVKYKKSTVENCDAFSLIRKTWTTQKDVGAIVSVIDLPGWPSLLVAPEDGWAQINVAALAKDVPSAELLDRRMKKELWRAFVLLFGGGNSSMLEGDLMRPVNSLNDLDAKPNLVPGPEPFNAVLMGTRARGIVPVHHTTYRQACIEGWAPMPTNEFQKAIFERINSEKERGPSNALKIVPMKK